MTEEYNEYADHTVSELWDLYFEEEERLKKLNNEPINYYILGDSMTYLSAMSQVWAIDGCRENMEKIRQEIDRKNKERSNEI
tara:strand:+ start:33 stop:278 length:246 start_codon:yes stop_codon:yes gene_type:complete